MHHKHVINESIAREDSSDSRSVERNGDVDTRVKPSKNFCRWRSQV